jgi:hypothetical protein
MSGTRTTFQRRHYRAVAAVLARAKARPNDSVQECIADLAQDFGDLFASDAATFRRSLFHDACNRAPKAREGRPS